MTISKVFEKTLSIGIYKVGTMGFMNLTESFKSKINFAWPKDPLGSDVEQERGRLYASLLDRALIGQILLGLFGIYLVSPFVSLWQVLVVFGTVALILVPRRMASKKMQSEPYSLTVGGGAKGWVGILSFLNALVVGGAAAYWFNTLPLVIQLTLTITLIGAYGLAIAVHHPQPAVMFAIGLALLSPIAFSWLNFAKGAGGFLSIVLVCIPCLAWYTAVIARRAIDSAILSRRREAELGARLESYSRELEAAVRAKNQFLAAAGHDLRQPLTSMQLSLTAFGNSNATRAPVVDDFVKRLQAPIDAMKVILTSLLEMSRLEAGLVKSKAVPVDLRLLFLRVQAEYRLRAAEKEIDLRIICPPLILESDPDCLERIIRNLVDNSLKFTKRGFIEINAQFANDQCVILVRDTGIGISAEAQRLVFDDYYQVSNSHRDRSQGLGLGLAIVRRLIELLDGHVSLSSTPGMGTQVELIVPTRLTRLNEPEAVGERVSLLQSLAGKSHVLIVDDDVLIRRALTELFNIGAIKQSNFGDAAEAIGELDKSINAPDLAILDYRMPGEINGIELGRDLIGRNGSVAVVIMTGDVGQSLAVEALGNGMEILHKPFTEHELAKAIAVARQKAVERLAALQKWRKDH